MRRKIESRESRLLGDAAFHARLGARTVAAAALLIGASAAHSAEGLVASDSADAAAGAAGRVVAGLPSLELRGLLGDVLQRNPSLAADAARARAAREKAPQVRALPDPTASLTAFLQSPETRVGPQTFSAEVFQALPWAGKLKLEERAALFEAAALEAEVEGRRLRMVTEARRLAYQLAFVDREEEIGRMFRGHLVQHEEIARARYSTGVGHGQAVVKVQAEITKVDARLLEIAGRRVGVAARINGLRAMPAAAPVPVPVLRAALEPAFDLAELTAQADLSRPEVAAAEARIAHAEAMEELAGLRSRPDFRVGLIYTAVDGREDAAGRAQPPLDNGDDVIALQGGVSLPVRGRKLEAGVREAVALQAAAQDDLRTVRADIETRIGDLLEQIDLTWQRLSLVRDLLLVQAEESLGSAQAGYIAGRLNALDLLDSAHVLFEAETAEERAVTDYWIGLAELEGAVGGPLGELSSGGVEENSHEH